MTHTPITPAVCAKLPYTLLPALLAQASTDEQKAVVEAAMKARMG